MPDLIIDGLPVSVAKGTTVIEAAESVGFLIPRLCWHKALGAAGACRLCAVMFTDGPVKGLHMSCMTPAADGMVVDTGHPEVLAFRRQVLEWLMANHPHDCPVCDEGGGCLLQDMTIAAGQSLRRYPGRKRTYPDQDLGPFIQHEMNRCIHCYRCARFYQDYCGYRDFGPMQNANRVYFGRFVGGALESPFAGNLADICPTGTLTDKTARYKARRWETERTPSVCPHCALGCHTVVATRNRAVVRIESRENPAGNGFFLCDRGRFSHGFDTAPDRPRQARVSGLTVPVDAALATTAQLLAKARALHGPGIHRLHRRRARGPGDPGRLGRPGPVRRLAATGPLSYRPGGRRTARRFGRGHARTGPAPDPDRTGRCGRVPRGLAPLRRAPAGLALRQASRQGAPVFVADPRPVDLPLPFVHLPVAPERLPALATLLFASPGEARALWPDTPELRPLLENASRALAAARAPVLVFAPSLAPYVPDDPHVGLCPVPLGANAAGAALLETDAAPGLTDIALGVAEGRITTLLGVEADPLAAFPDLAAQTELLIVCDHLPTATAKAASVFLPTTTLYESGGTLCGHLGRMERAAPPMPWANPCPGKAGATIRPGTMPVPCPAPIPGRPGRF
jgi:NADH-quinone oxidoreductase subunit G